MLLLLSPPPHPDPELSLLLLLRPLCVSLRVVPYSVRSSLKRTPVPSRVRTWLLPVVVLVARSRSSLRMSLCFTDTVSLRLTGFCPSQSSQSCDSELELTCSGASCSVCVCLPSLIAHGPVNTAGQLVRPLPVLWPWYMFHRYCTYAYHALLLMLLVHGSWTFWCCPTCFCSTSRDDTLFGKIHRSASELGSCSPSRR